MKSIILQAVLATIAVASAIPEGLESRGDSGCFNFQSPHCGISYGVCQCQNTCFYRNDNGANCQPPGGYLTCDIESLPGWSC